MTTYRVIAGNVGEVHSGLDLEDARSVFNVYVEQSKARGGRVAGEYVVLFADDDIAAEYKPNTNVLTFQVLDHGEDGSQYFPGCGTSGFDNVVTGVGDTGEEALADALESMAQNGALVYPEQESTMREFLRDPTRSAFDSLDHSECGEDHEGDDWHHYVSIRYTLVSP
jgi:hypothetical protein